MFGYALLSVMKFRECVVRFCMCKSSGCVYSKV